MASVKQAKKNIMEGVNAVIVGIVSMVVLVVLAFLYKLFPISGNDVTAVAATILVVIAGIVVYGMSPNKSVTQMIWNLLIGMLVFSLVLAIPTIGSWIKVSNSTMTPQIGMLIGAILMGTGITAHIRKRM